MSSPARPVRAPIAFRLAQALFLLLVLALAVPAGATTREFYFERLGSERGLTQGSVSAMVQDPQGFVWIGTQGGLHRYDGERYRLFRHDPADPASLPDSFVTALARGADGHSLWVGTYSQYVARLDLRSGRIRRFVDAAPGRREDRQVMAIWAEPDAVWIGTVAGLDRLDPATGGRTRVLALPAGPRVDRRAQQLLRDRAGRLWFASDSGLRVLEGRAEWRQVSTAPAHALLETRDGRLLVGGRDGLAVLRDGRLQPVWPRAGTSEPRRAVRAIAEDRAGRLWISAYTAGLRRIDPRDGSVVALRQDMRLPGTLPEDSVNSLLIDASGMLWAGGQFRGPAIADPGGSAFPLVVNLDHVPGVHAAADESIRAVHGTPGALWIGTDAHRFLRYDLRERRLEDLTPRMPPPSGRVVGFAPAGPSGLWLATETGLVRLEVATTAMRRVDLGAHSRAVLRSIAADARGGLWLGTSGAGALFHDPSTGRTRHLPPGTTPGALSHANVHSLLVDARGRVWLGTGDGLDLLEPSTGRLRRFRQSSSPGGLAGDVVRSLFQDAAGTVWVGTHAGLNRVVEDRRGIRFEQPLERALPDQRGLSVFSLQEAPPGSLWSGTDAGLLLFRPATGEARLFGLGDGLQDLEFNGGASARVADGRLVFGGVRGINLVDPSRVGDERYAAPLRLLSARSDGRALDDSPWLPSVISIPPGSDLLRVRVGALDFAPAATPRYRYRLEGFDRDWVDNGTSRDITYTQLPPGRYTFRAQATDRGGRWAQGSELRIPVTVATPLWRQPIVLLLLALVLLAPAGIALWQWRERRRRERGYLRRLREREERLKLALWASGEQFWDYDLSGGVMHRVQARDRDRDGGERGIESVTASEDDHAIHPEDLPRVQQQLRRHLSGELSTFESQHRIATPEGWTWVRARGRVVERDATGRALRIAGTARDITATRRAERDRRVASEVLRSMAEAVCVFDDDFNFISVNPAFTRMTGYVESDVVGQSTGMIDSRQHDESVYRQMREELRRDGRWSGELWQRRKDGSEFLCWLQASVVLDTSGQRGHWVAVLSDITDQKRAEQELRYLANYDTLTGLPNRALLSERLSRAVARARRHESRLAVLFLDLDRFKDINDSLGHAAGDAILRATAARLQHAVGGHHTVARLGGDEFTVVLEHVEGIEEAEDVARQLLEAFEQPLDAGDLRDIVISPSIGIAIYPEHADTPSDLLKHADTAMYKAKAIGRRTFMRYAGTMEADVRRRASLSAALRKVIDRDELRLVYQPRLHVGTGELVAVEALLRWRSEEFGQVSPAQFIPLAEESGLILEIGEWALRHACMQLQAWRAEGVDASMSVNVSALQLRRGDLARVIESTLHETGLPAQCLEIELTESIVMAEETWPALHAIRDLGVRMAIDDFGTGYSSLAYLKRLPINTLKIDREFIGDLTRDPDDEAITSAVIAMGHSLGLHVVAEGVETLEQLAFLRRYGCDEIQGYWLARPLEAGDCLAFLRGWRPAAAFAEAPEGAPVAP